MLGLGGVVCAVVAGFAAANVKNAPTVNPAWLGVVALQTGTTLVKVATTALPVNQADGRDARFKITNRSGAPISDLSIRLAAVRPANAVPPVLSGATVEVPGSSPSAATAGSSNTVNVPLCPAGLAEGATADVSLDISAIAAGAVASDLNDLGITASVNAMAQEAIGLASERCPHLMTRLN